VGRVGSVDDGAGFSAAVAAITSAFGDATRRGIYLFVRDSAGVTATEVAQHFALHPNVARHHLDILAAGGHVQVFVDHGGAGVGRPSKRYKAAAERDTSGVPAHRDDLLVLLLARLLPLVDPAAAEAVAYDVGAEYGRTLGAQMSPGEAPRSVRSAMQAVAGALTAHGFAAHAAEPADNTVVLGHCPFGRAAIDHPVLCAADRGLVEGLVSVLCGASVAVQLSSRAKGDAVCATVAG
jgi:predicted ArsR family transcriptional regulator